MTVENTTSEVVKVVMLKIVAVFQIVVPYIT